MAEITRLKTPPIKVLSFRSSGGYPLFKTILMGMVSLSVLFVLAIFMILNIFQVIVVLGALLVVILIVGLSPALTLNHLGASSLELNHGWYFRCTIPLGNIRDIEESEEIVPGHGVNFLMGGNKLFITNSHVGLVKIKLHDRQRIGWISYRNISEIVFNVDDPASFVRLLRKRAGLKPNLLKKEGHCPTCGQKMDEQKASSGDPILVPQVECIFLIHKDGRLIESYKSGRIQTKESFSVSGMLTVIQDFVGDAFKRTEGGLKTLVHGDLRVLIESGIAFYLALIIEGPEAKGLRKEMRRALKEVSDRYGDLLDEDWDGELTDLKDLRKILAQVLWI